MDKPARRSGIPPEIGVFALVAAASLPLGRLFRPPVPGETGFGSVQIATLVVAAFVAWGLRRLRVPALLSALLSAAAFLWFGCLLFHAGAMAGPLPTPRSLSLLLDTMARGLTAINVEAAPVPPSPTFLSITAMGIWATAWLADDAAIRLRHPLLAAGLAVPVFVMPGTLVRAPNAAVYAALFVGAALVVLFQDERGRLTRWAGSATRGWTPGLATRIGGLAVLAGALAAPFIPGYGEAPGGLVRARGGNRVTVNPLVSVRPSLDQFPAIELFHVRSPVPTYWRLTSLDRFNGQVWTATPEAATLAAGRGMRRTSPAPVTSRVTQRYQIEGLAGPWVPAAYEPVQVTGARGVRAQPVSRTLVASDAFRTGTRFSVTSEIPTPSAEDLAAESALDPPGDRYTALPEGVAAAVGRIAGRITAGASTRFEKAVALQDHLRTFVYDERVALRHNSADIVRFLTVIRAGYCEQFSAAMAVLARSLDIPARVAVGFGAGDLVDRDTYLVTSRHAHAWTEVYFPSYGWLAFEPTPRNDGFDVPSYARALPDGGAASPQPSPGATTSSPAPQPSETATPERDPGTDTTVGSSGDRRAVLPVAAGTLALLAAAALPGAAAARRILRRRRARDAREMLSVRYLEFLEWCRAASVGRSVSETPLEHARRLASRPGSEGAAEPLDRMATLATQAVYAPLGEDPGAGDEPGSAPDAVAVAVSARRAVAATLPRSRRLLPVIGWGWWRSVERPRRRPNGDASTNDSG